MNIFEANNLLVINAFGLLLLILKILGVFVDLEYFTILCIMFWQATVITGIVIGIVAAIGGIFIFSASKDIIRNFKG